MTQRVLAEPVGIVLAGGRGRRIGGSKAIVELQGKPLIAYPLAALRTVLEHVAVVAKSSTELPDVAGANVWIEPEQPSHPVAGIVRALELVGGRSVFVCAGDLPFVSAELVRALVSIELGAALAVIPHAADRLQPLCAHYAAAALGPLREALAEGPEHPTHELVATLDPAVVEVDDARAFFNVNAPEDLLTASAMLDHAEPRIGPR
jgi:molybdenum cofactor guanylyltransferase